MLSVGQLSFSSLLPGNGPSVIRLNFLTAASVTVRRSLMNKYTGPDGGNGGTLGGKLV